ncbi:MAG: prepilin peptidase [Clostridiales bacterium]|nr:prepilin peptidase [Clostridiales bacterium]
MEIFMDIPENCVLLGILTVLAWLDIKKREFPLPFIGFSGFVMVCVIMAAGEFSISKMIGGACVGGALLLMALATKESIGMGDGLMFCITGICLGLWNNLFLLFAATTICAVCGVILLAAKKCTRKESLPFAPFVLISDVLLLALTV